jgi:hypothetical protein
MIIVIIYVGSSVGDFIFKLNKERNKFKALYVPQTLDGYIYAPLAFNVEVI